MHLDSQEVSCAPTRVRGGRHLIRIVIQNTLFTARLEYIQQVRIFTFNNFIATILDRV